MKYPSVASRYGNTKEECESIGGVWVRSYRKSDGTYVTEYCRMREHKKKRI